MKNNVTSETIPKIGKRQYALIDMLVGIGVVITAGGFAFLLPDYINIFLRLLVGAFFGLCFLGLYLWIRKSDDIIEAETMLFEVISVAGWISESISESTLKRMTSELQEITQLIATTATTIFKEGVKGYRNEIRYLHQSINAVATMIREEVLDKTELQETVKMLQTIDDRVNQARMQRVARAKADLNFIQDLYSANDAATEAIATLQNILDSSEDKEGVR